ncbi:MAG: T9SS type A sorting domain-containing protein [Bacteroidetes bacterium]|nr:T9SS type A sorting domain-containing protein [Bacteroidota bacterium]
MKKVFFTFTFILAFALFGGKVFSQIAVTVTNPGNTTPNLSASYISLANALTDLNNVTAMTGPVTLTLTAGGSETAPPTGLTIGSATLNPVLSATNTVTIIVTGGTATLNAGIGTATPGSAAPDGILKIVGADYITIDGMTFTDGNASNPATMEFGVALFKQDLSDGAQNNTIKNCTFNMQRINNAAGTSPMVDGAVGILCINSTPTAATTALVPTTAAGSNSNNKFYTNTINSGNISIAIIGYAAATPFTAADFGNDVGGASLTTGNQILNFGGGAATNPSAGIRTLAQYNLNVSYNTVNNNNGGGVNHAATLRGIYINTATSANATVSNNTITVKGGGTTSQVAAIENVSGSTAAGNTITLSNNTITNCTYSTATSGVFYGIYNTASPANLNMSSNIFSNNSTSATSGSYYPFYNSGTVTVSSNFNNNSVNGVTFSAGSSAIFRGIYNTGGGSASTLNINSNNFQSITFTGAQTGECSFVYSSAAALTQTINSNTFTNLNLNSTSGTTYLIYNNITLPAAGSATITSNSIVTGLTKAAGGSLFLIYNNGGSPSGTTENWSNNSFSNITLAGATTFGGIQNSDGGAPTKTISGNTVSNVSGTTGAATGMLVTYGTATISGNTITNISAGGTVIGISAGNSSTTLQNISGNIINTLSSTGAAAVTGIISSPSGTSAASNIFKNKISNLSGSNASSTVTGISITLGTTTTVYNNILGDLRTTAANAANPLVGIAVSGGTTVNLYNNTVWLNGTSAGALFGSSAVSASTSPTLTMRNNLFVNLSTPSGAGLTVAYRRSSSTLTTYGSASNNNCLYAGTPGASNLLFYDGTNSEQTIAGYKTRVSPRDISSMTENVTFRSTSSASADFLKIDSTVSTQLESNGQTISTPAITNDYFDIARFPNAGYPTNPGFTAVGPDVGAHEFGGVQLDLNGPNISYTALLNTGSTGDRSLTAVITDASGVAGGANIPRLYYKKSTDVSYQVDAVPAVLGTNYTWNISAAAMGGLAAGDTVKYYVAAQDISGNLTTNPAGGSGTNPPGTTAPSSVNSYYITGASLSGDYNVGLAMFNRISGLNLKMEKFTRKVIKDVEVQQDAPVLPKDGKSAITIEEFSAYPKNTVKQEVTEEFWAPSLNGKIYDGPQYAFSSADNVGAYSTIAAAITDLNLRGVAGPTRFLLTDASYTEAASMTIAITNEAVPTATNTVTIKPAPLAAPSVTVNSTSPVFIVSSQYVIFDGSNTNNGTTRDLTLTNSGAGASSGVIFSTAANTVIKNLKGLSSGFAIGYGIVLSGVSNGTVTNCDIQKALIGIQAQAGSNNITFSNNSVGSVDSLFKVQNGGILVLSSTNFTVSGNTIVGVSRNATAGTSGIFVGNSGAPSAANGTIYNNNISNVKHSGYNGSAYSAYGVYLGTDLASSGITVYNNSIYDIYSQSDGSTGTGTAYTPHGIYIATGGGYSIYYNSISLYGQITDPDASPVRSGCITVEAGANVGTLDIRNNILQNTQTMLVTGATKKTYAFISIAANTAYSNLDYNDYYVSGADAILGYGSSADQLTIYTWRTFTGKDVNSISTDPFFTSATNLTPQTWAVNGRAIAISSVSTDILGAARNTTISAGPNDLGAYEFTPVFNAVATMVQTITGNGTYGFSFAGTTYGWITITGYTAEAAFDISWIHYQGVNPPGATTQQYNAAYDSIWVSNGSLGTSTYDVQIFVPKNNLRNIADTTHIILAKSNDGGASWNAAPGTSNGYNPGNPGFAYANGLTSFSLFAVTSTDNPLPVELASFTSLIDKRNVELKWSTSKEENNAGFDIERKLVSENTWSKVGSIQGAGNSNTVKNYNFVDNNVMTGKYNYRLKQIDFNGNHKYFNLSNEVVVGVPAKFELSQNYPNPFNPSTKINYDLPFDSKVQIKVFDMTGREVAQIVNETKTAGYYTAQFNASAMASGVYFYTITATGGSQSFVKTMKMVLVK